MGEGRRSSGNDRVRRRNPHRGRASEATTQSSANGSGAAAATAGSSSREATATTAAAGSQSRQEAPCQGHRRRGTRAKARPRGRGRCHRCSRDRSREAGERGSSETQGSDHRNVSCEDCRDDQHFRVCDPTEAFDLQGTAHDVGCTDETSDSSTARAKARSRTGTGGKGFVCEGNLGLSATCRRNEETTPPEAWCKVKRERERKGGKRPRRFPYL